MEKEKLKQQGLIRETGTIHSLMFFPDLAEVINGFVFKDLGFCPSLDERVNQHGSSHRGDGDGHRCGEHGGERSKKFACHPFGWPALLSVHQEHSEIKKSSPNLCNGLK